MFLKKHLYTFSFCTVIIFFLNHKAFSQRLYGEDGKALTIYECLNIADEKLDNGDIRESTRFLNNAATIYWEGNHYDSAIFYFDRSLFLNDSIKNDHGVYGITSNLAMIYSDKEDYKTALGYFEKTLEGRRKGNEPYSLISALINTSIVLNNLDRYDEAAVLLEEALTLARERNDADQMKSCYGMLSETYEKAGKSELAFHYFDLYRTFHEKVHKDKVEEFEDEKMKLRMVALEKRNNELEMMAQQQRMERELDEKELRLVEFDSSNRELIKTATKKELVIQLLNQDKQIQKLHILEQEAEHQTELAEEEAKRNIFIALAVFGSILSLIAFIAYRNKRRLSKKLSNQNIEITKQGDEILVQKTNLESAFNHIQKQKENITKSINYAERIQTAMLTARGNIEEIFPQSFIFFQPKDIVSGDFFWYDKKDDYHIIAAVDCTGHGVPGAFMSMIGGNILSSIIAEGTIQPSEILDKMHAAVIKTLNQEKSNNRDGMDMTVCTYVPESKKLLFAGANNPLIYFQNNELIQIKGTRMPIGGVQVLKKKVFTGFEQHEIDITTTTNCFIYSDGIQDQFGGPDNNKYTVRRFKQLLTDVQAIDDPTNQKETVKNRVGDWLDTYKQTDDMLLIGFKLS